MDEGIAMNSRDIPLDKSLLFPERKKWHNNQALNSLLNKKVLSIIPFPAGLENWRMLLCKRKTFGKNIWEMKEGRSSSNSGRSWNHSTSFSFLEGTIALQWYKFNHLTIKLYKGLVSLRKAGWSILRKHSIFCPPFPLFCVIFGYQKGSLYGLATAYDWIGTEAQPAPLASFCIVLLFQLPGLLRREIGFRLKKHAPVS